MIGVVVQGNDVFFTLRFGQWSVIQAFSIMDVKHLNESKVPWPSGLRRQLKALVLRSAGSNPAGAYVFPPKS